MFIALIVAVLGLSVFAPRLGAYSDWTGAYARVDKVVFEPNAQAPERIQIWGAFAIASKANRYDYDTAQRGYLYFTIKPGKEEICRKEWADFKAIAGTGQIVGFGSRQSPVRLRKASDKPADPEVYPLNNGLNKVGDSMSTYKPIRELRDLPKER
jgi:hypothetical protein